MTTRFLRVTDAAVRFAAAEASLATGTTTTLDVKRVLRAHGFWAVQADVSRRLARVSRAEGWLWWPLDGFRLYEVCDPRERHAAGSALARLN